ncbi:MAG: hypothetical protein A2015_00490 [Spirochaetes bacterium GWF1_31_7]|nr:MAG: hypothetical protein A2Y30_04020 [Spirochaetes bacterium GWE1_32_154]OHD45152.1 MAG: hypothetical protein A2Y29_15875 [Spirochaetes bacterium GWE2_31_10]OHD51061.1 MAG: hypothetical protein A2015_00490 [Spirochaetes bacterium GWF1_31_7]OHD73332.1 MAG: hypothetical protein A2355_18135 [Spirochaetes bacterium RIFOXYB1_FULL_32_8]HBD94384.1 hypothetical protein [Spirochaetia bacterium]
MTKQIEISRTIDEEQLNEIRKKIKYFYNKIECFFENKKELLDNYKQISIDEILLHSPKHYPMIQMIEQIYSFVTKDKLWLKHFLENRNTNFDWNTYLLWKSGKEYYKRKYDHTQCPSKWITEIHEQMIKILQSLQLLLYMEFYTLEDDFKAFLKKNSVVDYRMRANFVVKSYPSENLDKIFEVIDFLLKISIDSAIHTNYIIDTIKCMEVYRFIDASEIFTLLKKKEFYVRYRLEFLKLTPQNMRLIIPQEDDILSVGEEFLMTYQGLLFSYNEYKKKLIDKYNVAKTKIRF